MKRHVQSLQRRRMMIAGSVGMAASVAAPAVAFAGQCVGTPVTMSNTGRVEAIGGAQGGALILSGRILGMDCKPFAGATVEAWHAHAQANRTTATTDADGRFMFTTTAPAIHAGRVPNLSYRVSREGRKLAEEQLYFTRESGIAGNRISQWQRDDSGTWRATCGFTVA